MNSDLEKTLLLVINALEFSGPESFVFAGRTSAMWMNGQARPGSQNPVADALQNALYGSCYTRRFRGSLEDLAADISEDATSWVEALSGANTSKDRWEEGWQVQQFLPSGQIYGEKRGMVRAFWPGEFITRANHGMAPQPGTPIAVYFPRESRNLQPGFYFVFGETTVDQHDELPTVRYYWNIKREGAVPLVRELTSRLNKYQVPFRLKILNHPGMLGRSDAAILYLGRRYYRAAAEICRETHDKVRDVLDEPVPLFTLRLAKGLAFAEDPGTQESFGMMRCRLLAESLCAGFSEGRTAEADRLERVRQHFLASGISLEQPFLNSGSVASYEFPQ
jgi:HopA1 effector protein family